MRPLIIEGRGMGDAGREVRVGSPRDATGRAGGSDCPIRPGLHVGRYEVGERIGRGGMGIIFRARDLRLQRDVALKFAWPRATDPVVRERFRREAIAASQLTHEHLVPIFEYGSWRGIPWLAMGLVEGRTLRELLSGGQPLDIRMVLETAAGLARALREAHGKGIIHRDVNPSNILIRDPDRWALLTDFGLAADPSGQTVSEPLTAPGHVIGTAGYMSPEQILGRPLDPRSDIFSLGAVIYEMCTGKRAFLAGEAGGVTDAVLHLDPPSISSINSSVPTDLDRVVRKALAKDPADRHRDASELVTEIVAVQAALISAEYPTTSARPSRRNPQLAAWGTGLAVVGFAAWSATRLPSRPPPRDDTAFPSGSPLQVTRDPGWEAQPAISPDGQSIAYTAAAADTSDIWIADPTGGSRLRLTDDPAADHSPAWLPDGSALAFVSDRGGEDAIWKIPRLGGSAVLLVPNALDPAISPDGKRIAFARRTAAGYSRISVASLAGLADARTMTTDEDARDHIQPAWSPDGRALCYTDGRNLWLVDAEGGRPRPLTRESATDISPVWSADGRYVIFTSSREGTQALWRVPSEGGVAERLTIGTGPEGDASLSRDGSRVVYSTYLNDYDIVLVNLATRDRSLIETRLYESAPAFAPDGSAVAYTSSRPGGRMDLWLQPLSDGRPSGPLRQLTDLPGTVNTPAFSPDGRWVAFKHELEGRVGIWVTGASGGLPQRFTGDAVTARHPAWSPEGNALAYVVEGGARSHVWVAPVRDGRPAGRARPITSGNTTDQAPDWSPDGRTIAYVSRGDLDAIRVVPPAGGGSRLIARRTGVGRLRWAKGTGWLWFSATSPRGVAQLWKVPPDGGEPVAAASDDMFAEAVAAGDFELSSDGRLLAYTRQQTRGDIWLVGSREAK